MHPARKEADVAQALACAGELPPPVERPAAVLMAGLPGTGKTTFARALSRRLPAAHLESDCLRYRLFRAPRYTPGEHARVFLALEAAARRLLIEGRSVIVDAMHLKERDRRGMRRLCRELGAPLLVVAMDAPDALAEERVRHRPREGDHSRAGPDVYRAYAAQSPPPHGDIVVDSSRDIEEAVEWVRRELGARQ